MARKIYDLKQALEGLAETFSDPKSDKAFKNNAFSYLVARVDRPECGVHDSDTLVLLGKPEDVVHAIVVRGSEIIADRQVDKLGIASEYRPKEGHYITKLASGLKESYILTAVHKTSLLDFYRDHGLHGRSRHAFHDDDNNIVPSI